MIDLVEFPATESVFDLPVGNVTLQDGKPYYVKIVVQDGVGWKLSGASDGVLLDKSPPRCDGLFAPKDGPDQFLDRKYHGVSSSLEATWNYAFDTISQNMLKATIQAQRVEEIENETWVYPLSSWIEVSDAKKATVQVPATQHGNTYRVAVLLTDHAGNEAECYTDGITVGVCLDLFLDVCICIYIYMCSNIRKRLTRVHSGVYFELLNVFVHSF